MAYPGDLSNPVAKSSGAARTARLTPDDFEQLAAAFRPSWELDDAPFTGAGTMAPADLRALQSGGGTHADVRDAAHAGLAPAPAAHAPMAQVPAPVAAAVVAPAPVVPAPAPVVPGNGAQLAPGTARAHDPVPRSGGSGITAADIAAAGPLPPPAAPTPLGPPVVARPPPSADRLAKTRIVPRAPPAVPAPKESTGSFDLGRSPFGRRSKGPLWIGAGVGAVALAAAGIWAATGGSETKTPPPPPVLVRTAEPPAPAIPPPPPETTATVVAPPPKVTPVAAPPPAPPPVQAAPPPVVVQRPVVAPAAPPPARPVYVAPAAPRPAPRPKGGNSTIVHDVPF
jgi:hypothetical protein